MSEYPQELKSLRDEMAKIVGRNTDKWKGIYAIGQVSGLDYPLVKTGGKYYAFERKDENGITKTLVSSQEDLKRILENAMYVVAGDVFDKDGTQITKDNLNEYL